jgi:vitamin B12 transporter
MRFFIALQFLTIIPVRIKKRFGEDELARSAFFFPLVGIILGLALGGVEMAASQVFPVFPVSVILIAVLAALTGGLHLDGLADTADALFSGKGREEKLRIMKSGQIGAMGASALALTLLLKAALISSIPGKIVSATLILFPASSRCGLLLPALIFRYARPEGGTGKPFIGPPSGGRLRTVLAAVILTVLFAAGLLFLVGLIALGIVFAVAVSVGKLIASKIGGLTGDALGAINEVCEITFIGAICALSKLALFLCLFLLLFCGSAMAQEPLVSEKPAGKEVPVMEPEEVVVTGNLTEKRLGELTVPITVIDAQEIEKEKAQSLSGLLRDVPGVFVRQEGTVGARTSVLLRGAHPTQTLVLIDGIEVNDPNLGGAFDFSDFDTTGVERIEVVRGSYSALYGSSAVGGVINIITKKGAGEPRLSLESLGGSFDTARLLVGGTGGSQNSNWSLCASRFQTNNAMPHNSHWRETFAGKTGTVLGGGLTLEFLAYANHSQSEDPYDYGSPLPLDDNITRERDQYVLGAKLSHKVSDVLAYSVKSSFFDTDSYFENRGDTAGAPDEFTSVCESSVSTLQAQVETDLAKLLRASDLDWQFVTGGQAKRITSLNFAVSQNFFPPPPTTTTLFEDETEDKALYFHNELVFSKKLTLSAGLRVDRYGSLPTNYLPRVGAKLFLSKTTALKENYGEGFRAPNPIEFFDPWVGNPNLKPEKSRSYDRSIEQSFFAGKVKLEATYFKIRVKDLIAWDPSTFILENYKKTETEGAEFALTCKPVKRFAIGLSYTYQDARDLSDNSELPGRSPHFGGLKLAYSGEKLTALLDCYFSEAIPSENILDEKGRTQSDAAKAKLVNFAVGYKVSPQAEIFLKLTNLLDERYKESQTAPYMLPFAAYLGLSLTF